MGMVHHIRTSAKILSLQSWGMCEPKAMPESHRIKRGESHYDPHKFYDQLLTGNS